MGSFTYPVSETLKFNPLFGTLKGLDSLPARTRIALAFSRQIQRTGPVFLAEGILTQGRTRNHLAVRPLSRASGAVRGSGAD